jgi:putative solute:sodium symporter small subunit
MSKDTLTPERASQYWHRTRSLMFLLLFLWFIASFVVHFFAIQLNTITVGGFPLGFYMAAQGSLIIFVILCFWNARSQDKIDEEFGMTED